jgi:hypothetical protein
MKNIIAVILLLVLQFDAFCQNTTISPEGVFIPRVNTLGTCAVPSIGQMVYFNTDNKMYFCNGSTWQSSSEFSLPFITLKTSDSDLLSIVNNGFGGSVHGRIENPLNNDYAIYGYSTGTGAAARFSNVNDFGHALQTSGKLNFSMASVGKDKVLTSDSEGNATWKQGINHNISFAARGMVINQNGLTFYPNNEYSKVNFKNTDYDIGNDFSISTDAFTAPINGIYHFDVQIKQVYGVNSNNWYSISLWTGDNFKLIEVYCSNEVSQSATLSTDIQLFAGMTVTAKVYPNNDYNTAFYPEVELSRFSGHLVSRLN